MAEHLTRAGYPALVRKGPARAKHGSRFSTGVAWFAALLLVFFALFPAASQAQRLLGAINGTVKDTSGAVVPGATVTVVNVGTNLTITAHTNKTGSYNVVNLPLGTYTVTVSRSNFKTVEHSQVLVQANRTSTVNSILQPGAVSSKVTVSATPMLDQTSTTNGYVLGSHIIQSTPLGTGSFTQLATLAPGVSADFLSGSGTNAGLGNQNIFSNGQRDTSNSISFNGITGNNVFNGKTSSAVSEARFVLNTNEDFLAGGQIQTNTSVYDAIGQGLPTPPPETLQEMHVETSMYGASQGQKGGAHIEVVTKSGTNQFHGQAYEYTQTSAWDANKFFLNAGGISKPSLNRNTFGGMLGGPVLHNKIFFFGSYQGQRVSDAYNALSGVNVPINLSGNRSETALINLVNSDYGTNITASQVDPVALKLMQAKASNGQYLVPSQTISDPTEMALLGYNALVKGPSSTMSATQINANTDYDLSQRDRFSEKYYYQHNPTTSPFAVSSVLGFPQSLNAGSQVVALDNIFTPTPNTSWEQRLGFVREFAYAHTGQAFTPQSLGLNILGSSIFPGITVNNANTDTFGGFGIGPSNNFANAGVFQNQFEGETYYTWIKGNNNTSFGADFSYGQLNVINKENQVAQFSFNSFPDFFTGKIGGRSSGVLLNGETNRYFRYKQLGLYAEDQLRLTSNLNLDLGLRWDWDGPLYEKNGMLTNFYPQDYSYNLSTDTISNYGLVVAGNNKQFCATKHPYCVNNSTLTGRQWMFEPRIGVAWSPSFIKNFVVRTGFGIYANRGEYFTEFSPSAGLGISGPFGVTTEEPFTVPFNATCQGELCLSSNPFGTAPPPAPPSNFSGVEAEIPNQSGLSGCAEPVTPTCTPTGTPQFAYRFGGYNPANNLPYTENWTVGVQWQLMNSMVLTVGYVGNHGVNEVLPIPFNQALIATPQHPVNGQIYSYGFQATDVNGNPLKTEQVMTTIGEFTGADGNTALRVPYIGYNPNSDFNTAEGISNYNALQIGLQKRMSRGLMFDASYTWSHALDEGSGLQLFYNGNNPLNPSSAYGNAGFDRTHVFSISYLYEIPSLVKSQGFAGKVLNGWGFSGVTVAESGMPYSVYDFSGDVASQYWGAGDDFITNPTLGVPGGNVNSVLLQGTTGVNAGQPILNGGAFGVTINPPGTNGVPPCGPTTGGGTACDYSETSYSGVGRNIFRGPFQTQFNFDLFKSFKLSERFTLRYDVQLFNIFNHPSFDAPNNNFTLDPCFGPNLQTIGGANSAGYGCQWYGTMPAVNGVGPFGNGQAPAGQGFIQDTIGSSRFIQMAFHLTF